MTRTLALLLALLPGTISAADPPVEPLKVPPRPLEEMRFPPGTVVVVPDVREGLGKINGVILAPEEYRKLLETVEQLTKKSKPDKPQPPSVCRITGKVEQRGMHEVVRVRAVFEFASPAQPTTYFLGFRRAAAVAASLDGKDLPALEDGPDGFTVTIDALGRHSLALDLELPLQPRGTKAGERGFALNLPGSPITRVDQFELPPGVDVVRLRPLTPVAPLSPPAPAETVPAKDLQKPAGDWPALALKQVEGIEFSWDNPAPQRPAEPLLSADGEVRVQVGDAYIQTTASLLLRSLRGRVNEWKLQTPAGADVTLPGLGIDPGPSIKALTEDKSQWLIRIDGGSESLTAEVQVRQPRQQGKPAAVGPFNVAGAFRQQGTIRVLAPNHLRPRLSGLRNDLVRRELPAEAAPVEAKAEFLQAAYGYGQVTPAAPTTPLLHVDTEAVAGALRTQVSHRLTLTDTGWRLLMEIKATPIRSELESLEVELPAALQRSVEAAPPELVEKIEPVEPGSNRWRIRLAHPRRTETTVRLEALYPHANASVPSGRETASLVLPRVRQAHDADSRITVIKPEGYDLAGAAREWDRDRIGDPGRPLEAMAGQARTLTLMTARPLAAVDLTWVAETAAVPVRSLADVTLEERQVTVRQSLTLPAAGTSRQLLLRVAGPAPSQLRALEGGTVAARGEREWLLTVPGGNREATVVLAYWQPLTAAVGRVDIGLLWPATAGKNEVRARVWGRPSAGLRPLPAGAAWEDLPPEPAPERDSLPALALLGGATPAPLSLEFIEAVGLAPAGVIAERVLVQVVAGDAGQHRYLARFRLHRVAAASLDLELPAAVANMGGLEVFVNGKRLDQVVVVDDAAVPAGRVIRVPLPADAAPIEMSVGYFLADEQAPGRLAGRWLLDLKPPQLRGPVFVGPVRWHVLLSEDVFVLPVDERAVLEQRWGWRRVLPVPSPGRTARELEEWFRGEPVETVNGGAAIGGPGAVLRQSGLEPIRLVPVSRMMWYLVCSLAVLGVGGALVVTRRTRWLFWPALTLLLAAVGTCALLWPQTTQLVVAGGLPGGLVLSMLLLLTAWQARRHYRRVVFLPSFSRTKPPSTASRAASSQSRRLPSTVDVPPVT